jgi:triosephosphate isomerase
MPVRPLPLVKQAGVAEASLEVVVAPPALYLLLAREHLRKGIEVAAQNVFDKPNGAFTGEISASQLKDSGITWTLTGHSERRTIIGEKDEVGRCHPPDEGHSLTQDANSSLRIRPRPLWPMALV